MARSIVPIELNDFSGGWNLNADQFKLARNEVPEIYNMIIDRAGSLRTRKGWDTWGDTHVAGSFAGRNFFFHSSTNVRQVLTSSAFDHKVRAGTGGAWTDLGITTGATPHEADFAAWNQYCYIACGIGQVGNKWDGSTATALTASASGAWQDDYDLPTGTHMPKAEFVQRHADRLWVAYTNEDSTDYPQRVRYSHFNQPESWRELDYIDLPLGGGQITGLQAFKDTLLVFKESQVWAIYGYDPDQFNAVNLTSEMGIPNRNAVSASEQRCYFYDLRVGVWSWDGKRFTDHFEKLRPAIDLGWITSAQLSKISLDVLDRQVWVALPYLRDGVASYIYATFIFDETVGKYGAWTQVFSAAGRGIRNVINYVDSDGTKIPLGREGGNWMLQLDARDDAKDDYGDAILGAVPFSCGFHTSWIDVGTPGQKASWRAPDYVISDQDADSRIKVRVFQNYDETNVARQHNLDQTAAAGTSLVWGVGNWDEALWGGRALGALLLKGSPLGSCYAVKLNVFGSQYTEGDGVPWGVNSIVFKATPRKLR